MVLNAKYKRANVLKFTRIIILSFLPCIKSKYLFTGTLSISNAIGCQKNNAKVQPIGKETGLAGI